MSTTPLQIYLAKTPPDQLNNATVAYLANLTETGKSRLASPNPLCRNWPINAAT